MSEPAEMTGSWQSAAAFIVSSRKQRDLLSLSVRAITIEFWRKDDFFGNVLDMQKTSLRFKAHALP